MIGDVKNIKLNTDVAGTEEASRTICRTEDSMVVFMCDSNKANCHQRIKNPNRNYPAGWIDVDSIDLQEPLPLSRVGYLETEQKNYSTSRLTLTTFYFTNRLRRL